MNQPNQLDPNQGTQNNQTFTFLSAMCSEPEVVISLLSKENDGENLELTADATEGRS